MSGYESTISILYLHSGDIVLVPSHFHLADAAASSDGTVVGKPSCPVPVPCSQICWTVWGYNHALHVRGMLIVFYVYVPDRLSSRFSLKRFL